MICGWTLSTKREQESGGSCHVMISEAVTLVILLKRRSNHLTATPPPVISSFPCVMRRSLRLSKTSSTGITLPLSEYRKKVGKRHKSTRVTRPTHTRTHTHSRTHSCTCTHSHAPLFTPTLTNSRTHTLTTLTLPQSHLRPRHLPHSSDLGHLLLLKEDQGRPRELK